MNNIIPVDLILKSLKDDGYMEQLSLIKTMPEYEIDEGMLTDVMIRYSYINAEGNTRQMTTSADHPSFAALREHLGAQELIKIERNSWNGDKVLQPFKLNGHEFRKGDKFMCAAAMGNYINFLRKKR